MPICLGWEFLSSLNPLWLLEEDSKILDVFLPILVGFLWFSGFMALSVSARLQGLSSTVAYGIDSESAS